MVKKSQGCGLEFKPFLTINLAREISLLSFPFRFQVHHLSYKAGYKVASIKL